MAPNSDQATIWELSKSDLADISQSGRLQQLLQQKLGGLSGTTALQRLRGWRLQRLIKIPVPSSELPTAEQPVMAMSLQLLLQQNQMLMQWEGFLFLLQQKVNWQLLKQSWL